jgi:hypothetical protein
VYGFWDGAQGWMLKGLSEYQDITEDDALRSKMHDSFTALADNLTIRPIDDLREDYRRSSIIAYYLKLASTDTSYPEASRTSWANRAEELFRLSLVDKNTIYTDLNRYGLTYARSADLHCFS